MINPADAMLVCLAECKNLDKHILIGRIVQCFWMKCCLILSTISKVLVLKYLQCIIISCFVFKIYIYIAIIKYSHHINVVYYNVCVER